MLNFLAFLLLVLGVGVGFWYGAWRILRSKDHGRDRVELLNRGICASCGYSLTGIHSSKCPECGANTDPWVVQKSTARKPNYSRLQITLIGCGFAYVGLLAFFRARDVFFLTLVFGAPLLALVPWVVIKWLASYHEFIPRRAVTFVGVCAIIGEVLAFLAIFVTKPLKGAGMEAIVVVLFMPIPMCLVSAGLGALFGALIIATGCTDRLLGYKS